MSIKDSNNQRPRLVMVLGASHSGTTMLDLMLGNNDATFSTGEVWAAFHPFRKHHFDPHCGCGQQNCPVWAELLKAPESQFHLTAASQPGIGNVVDSSKDLSWIIDSATHAANNGIEMHNVVIWKEPVELAYSFFKREWTLEAFRYQYLTYYERFLDTQLPFVAVRFSALAAEPAATLKKLCAYTGLPWQEGQEEFWNKQHHHMFGAHKTGKQSREGKSEIRGTIDYPEEFFEYFDEFSRHMATDKRMMRVVGALDSMDIHKVYVPRLAKQTAAVRAVKPAWYYYHKLKRIYRKHFPETFIPTAADLN